MSYAERRDGKITGRFIGEVVKSGKTIGPKRAFKTKGEADGYEAYVKANGSADGFQGAGDRHTGVTFAEVAELCRDAGGPRRARWKAGKDKSVQQRLDFVVSVLGHLDIAAVTTPELDKLVARLQKLPGNKGARLSPATINRYLTAASAVLTFASGRGFIQGRPLIPLQEEDGAREATVSDEMEAAILRWLNENDYRASAICVSVLIETGMRAGELQAVAPEQIVEQGENGWIMLRADQVKTKAARRVWIRPDLARDFRALVASGERPNPFTLARNFKQAAGECGDGGELVIHSLRHTRATRLLEAGVDPQITMEMLGWTSFNTMKRYRHVKPAMHAEAAKKVSLQRGETGDLGNLVRFPLQKTA
jgi:integrase